MPVRLLASLCLLLSVSVSVAQDVTHSETELTAQVASGGYIPVSLLEEGLRSCEDLSDHQLDQCGAILLNAIRTAFKFRTYSLPSSNTIVTRTDIFDRNVSSQSSNSSTHDMRSQIFDLEVELDILVEENRHLWHQLSKTRER